MFHFSFSTATNAVSAYMVLAKQFKAHKRDFPVCGDSTDITTDLQPEADCNLECPGDPIHLCGGGNRLQFYEWNGTMNVWQNPPNIGRYEVSI